MICRRILGGLCSLLLFVAPTSAQSLGLLSRVLCEQHGLDRAWHSQAVIDRGFDRVANVTLHLSYAKSQPIFEVVTDEGVRFVYTEHDPGRFGIPLGAAGAKAQAQAKVAALKKDRRNAQLVERSIGQLIVIVQSERGSLTVFDGETGRRMWSTQVGRHDYPTTAAGANDTYVAAVNGSTLYAFGRADGRLAWKRQVGGPPTAGPALTRDYAYVPMATGRVEGFRLASHNDPAWAYMSHGQVFVQPTVTPRSVVWPTSQGHLYIGRANEPAVRFRLETRDAVTAQPTYKFFGNSPLLIAGSRDGYVYAMHEVSGSTLWRFSTGAPITAQPVVVGDMAFVCPQEGGMFALELLLGNQQWHSSRASRCIAVSDRHVYGTDDAGRLVKLDQKTGGFRDSLPIGVSMRPVVNHWTDRIYLVTDAGLVQCLRDPGIPKPLMHVPATEQEETAARAKGKPKAKPKTEEEAPAEDMPKADEPPAESTEETPAGE